MAVKTPQKHGYWGLQVGLGWRNPKNITKPMLGHFEVCGVAPKKVVKEFRVKDEAGLLKSATVIGADHFIEGQYVDVQANCKGKGFAGVRTSDSQSIVTTTNAAKSLGNETSWLEWSTCFSW